jgi:hypothetical protein
MYYFRNCTRKSAKSLMGFMNHNTEARVKRRIYSVADACAYQLRIWAAQHRYFLFFSKMQVTSSITFLLQFLLPALMNFLTFYVLCLGVSSDNQLEFCTEENTSVILSQPAQLPSFRKAVSKSSIFCDISLCSPLIVNRRFGGICRLHHQSLRIM